MQREVTQGTIFSAFFQKGFDMQQTSDFHATLPPPPIEHLTRPGANWLQSLPVPIRPLITANRHAHIINKLSILWGNPDDLSRYLGELILSSRPGRRGFAPEVLEELLDLQRALQEQGRI